MSPFSNAQTSDPATAADASLPSAAKNLPPS